MCIRFCPLQIFAINYLKAGYSQHYEICTLLKMKPQKEINFSSSIEYLCFQPDSGTVEHDLVNFQFSYMAFLIAETLNQKCQITYA